MAVEDSRPQRALAFYKSAALLAPRWSVPRYNIGLREKYRGNWRDSLKFNRQAVLLDSEDEAGWWNLGIAATALRNWQEAKRAWTTLKIEIFEKDDGELRMAESDGCVRLNPERDGEVVWGIRLDPPAPFC